MIEPRHILLYDCDRDKNLRTGEVILVYDDGSTKRIREIKENTDVRTPIIRRRSNVRGRAIRKAEYPKVNAGHVKKRTQLPLC